MKIGIMGAGAIARVMARTILALNRPDIELYAIASRSKDRADVFAFEFNVPKSYGSYTQLVCDKNVDLVYIATPHSEHYANTILCIDHKKAALVEKAFTANHEQALDLIHRARKANVLITEAIWTRYMPSRALIAKALEDGLIGKVKAINANLCYPIDKKERVIKPELAGGALLDIGIYPLNFALMFFGHEIKHLEGFCVKHTTGVDFIDNIAIEFSDGKTASLYANACVASDRMGYIYGSEGYIAVTNINNPEKIEVFNKDHERVSEIKIPKQVTGYEYQLIECKDCLDRDLIECPSMTHKQTLEVMQIMDNLRRIYGVTYPFENK